MKRKITIELSEDERRSKLDDKLLYGMNSLAFNGNHCSSTMTVCLTCTKMRRRNYVAQTQACSKSVSVRLKRTCGTCVIHFDHTIEQLQHGRQRNVHLEIRNIKQTELHRLKNRGKKG